LLINPESKDEERERERERERNIDAKIILLVSIKLLLGKHQGKECVGQQEYSCRFTCM